ncbi:MFS transporter [Actinomadura xylanilytica]|uniref:MFS transporter n=1 Tax=Actinomadura xylanilytica TaxID=887459 RepID=UPI00255B0261|nr:MFS transporter [Actinomadura xylanilytica]MDL4772267.1 MFS transporter [Actinomadura xylanilytica]
MSMPDNRRWWGLGALAFALLALGFDMTILNVALTTLSEDLHASTSRLQWIVDAYVLVFAALLLPAGLLGDRFGRKRLLLAGMVIFGAASLGGALADGPGGIIVARAVMGIGAAIITPLSMSLLPAVFPPEERTRAVAVWSAAMALGLPLGPLLGGWLLEHFWWGSIFLINVPVVAIAAVAVAFLLPESRDPSAPRVDWPGSVLSMGGLAGLVYGVTEGPARGWTDPVVPGAIAGGLVLLACFVGWERRLDQPMMDVGLFRDRTFLWAVAAGVLGTLVMSGTLFVLPQYLQVIQGNSVFGTGLRLIPMLLGLMAGGLATDRLSARTGNKAITVAGLFVLAAGLGIGALTGVGDSYTFTGAWLGVLGLGIGLTMVPAMDTVLGTLPENQMGRGAGLVQTLRQTGGALGIAGLGSLLSSIYRDRLETGSLPGTGTGGAASEAANAAAETARGSLGGAAAVAGRLGDGALMASARDAYVGGMGATLTACAVAALATAVLVWVFAPGRRTERAAPAGDGRESIHEHAAS